jgi:hypothetical protein
MCSVRVYAQSPATKNQVAVRRAKGEEVSYEWPLHHLFYQEQQYKKKETTISVTHSLYINTIRTVVAREVNSDIAAFAKGWGSDLQQIPIYGTNTSIHYRIP